MNSKSLKLKIYTLSFDQIYFQAFVIAYTSEFIPRYVYTAAYSQSGNLEGYIDSSLSKFNTSHYTAEMRYKNEIAPPICQFRGYRYPPEHPTDPYGHSYQYWQIFSARLAFVVIFEHFVSLLRTQLISINI